MAKTLTMDNPYFWAGLSGVCDQIVKLTAPGDCCAMPAEALALFSEIAEMTPKQMIQLALAIREMKANTAREEARV